MSQGTEKTAGLTAGQLTSALFGVTDHSTECITARTPHGSYRFHVVGVERHGGRPQLVLEPIESQSSAPPADLPTPPPGVAETAARESERTADLRDAVLRAFAATGTATIEWGEAEPLTPDAVAAKEAELRQLMVDRVRRGVEDVQASRDHGAFRTLRLDDFVAGALSDDDAASLQEHHFPPLGTAVLGEVSIPTVATRAVLTEPGDEHAADSERPSVDPRFALCLLALLGQRQ